jgi:hypothetical protein
MNLASGVEKTRYHRGKKKHDERQGVNDRIATGQECRTDQDRAVKNRKRYDRTYGL